jgi:hypothetical protein
MPNHKAIAERLVNRITTKLKKAERSQKGKICVRMRLNDEETIAVLTTVKLPHEIMVMFNNPQGSLAISSVQNIETVWHEIIHDDKGCQDATVISEGLRGLPNIKVELWATRLVPYCEGKRRYIKATANTYSYAYKDV